VARLRLKARWRLAKAAVKVFVALVALLVLAGFILLRTGLGHRLALEYGLDQVRTRVAGGIEVAEIRSANLIRGARLVGVRLFTPEGDPFVTVDSIEVSYHLPSLLRGNLVLADVQVWHPRLVLARYPGEESGTLGRWIGPRTGGGGPPGPSLLFRGGRIVDADVTWIEPMAPPDTAGILRWEPSDGGPVRSLSVTGLDAAVREIGVGERQATLRAEIRDVRATASVLRRPLDLSGADMDLLLADDTLGIGVVGAVVEGAAIEGRVALTLGDSAGVGVAVDAVVQDLELARFRWLVPSLPAFEGRTRLLGQMTPTGQRWTASELDGWIDGGRVAGSGTIELNGDARLRDVDLRLSGVPLTVADPFLDEPLLVEDGRVSGTVRLAGPVSAPTASGRVSLTSAAYAPTLADFSGTVRLRNGLAFEGFTATLDPLDWTLVADLLPGLPFRGPGRATVRATGSLGGGLRFEADLVHAPPGATASRVVATGGARRVEEELEVDVTGDLTPLSLEALTTTYPDLPLAGEVSGSVRARGPLTDLTLSARVATELGRLDVVGRVNARDPTVGYRLEGEIAAFRASALVPALPDPSTLTGHVRVEGSGRDPATLVADASIDLGPSRIGRLRVDSLRAAARVRDGVLVLDTLTALAGGVSLDGGGTLALDTVRPAGEMRVHVATESLLGLRPVFMGDSVIARDDLDAIERGLLALEGVDPDTLPTREDVAMGGRVDGRFTLTGAVADFAARGRVELEDVRYGRSSLAAATLEVDAEGLPALGGPIRLTAETGAAVVLERSFASGRLELDYQRPEGRALVELVRNESEDYRVRATFEVDSLGGALDVDELALRFDSVRYGLAGPARLAWSDSALQVSSFELMRPAPQPMSIRAEGVLPRRGSADFTLEASNLRLEQVVELAQIEDLDLEGGLDLDLRVEGTAAEPVIGGTFAVRDVRLESVDLSRLEGELDYSARSAGLRVDAWRGDLHVLELEGSVPVDLALRSVDDRTPEADVDLRARLDSLPAAFFLSLLEDLEDVRGVVSGELDVGGRLNDPRAEGTLRLVGGAWTVAALGVRQAAVEATLSIGPDDRVEVTASGRAGGRVEVDGTVDLAELRNPAFDLAIRLNEFRGVERRDVEGTVSGELRLTETYERPFIAGRLRVDEGVLFLEEFQRSASVVDLSDPRFFAYVDTSMLVGRPLLAETRNPFMNNLRVSVDLAVARNTWLRSPDMNVEIGGDLIVVYDRPSQDLVMIGELEAVRGQYTLYGRVFEVDGGTVEFVGTPGINPNLEIRAEARVRRTEGDPFNLTATLGGTLVDPTVSLSTESGGVPESDLISYLVFGRPSTEVNSLFTENQASGFQDLGVSFGLSTLATSLGSLAQGLGVVDYLAITQRGAYGAGLSPFSGTQVEFGQYLFGGDYFAAITLRPPGETGRSNSPLGGFRLEWQASDQFHVEAFLEDRFLRSGGFGFQDLGIESKLIYGLSLVREWGY
jgi:hypothetical protein